MGADAKERLKWGCFNGAGLGSPEGRASSTSRATCTTVLQWGRAWEPGGAPASVFSCRSAARLQWGRAWEPGGAEGRPLALRVDDLASMGPGLGARRGLRSRRWPRCSARSFNGAGLGSPEGLARSPRFRFQSAASMGPGLGARRGMKQPWVAVVGHAASMGPGLGARRGVVVHPTVIRAIQCRFNGAGLGSPEGHADVSAVGRVDGAASMGPGLGARRGIGCRGRSGRR